MVVQLVQRLGLVLTEFTPEGVVAVGVPGQGPRLGGQGHLQGLPRHLAALGVSFRLASSCCGGLFGLDCLGRVVLRRKDVW